MRKITAISAILLMFFCFVGCSHDYVEDYGAELCGFWECEKLIMDNTEYTETFMDSKIPISAVYTLAVSSDGTGWLGSPMSTLYGDTETKQSFRWTADKNGLTINGEDSKDEILLEYIENKLIMTRGEGDDEVKVWFTKVEKFSEFSPDMITDTEKGENK
ncbi:MAG: hypothetical protein MJ100_04800 [Ruminococcus sp.]|nr:hypothetical protein [Ruminococcus sp.]